MTTDAAKPFDSSAKADVILRSSDSVDFYFISLLLSAVSPVFSDMFSLNRPGVQQEITNNGLPVVPLPESSKILQFLLCLVYPCIDEPELVDGELCAAVCIAAQKYCMDVVEGKLKKMILASSLIKGEPLRIYSIAVYMGPEWDSVAVKAAENTLEIPLSSLPSCPELSWMTGGDLYHYVTWRLGRESQNSRSSYITHTIHLILRTPPSPGDSKVVTRTTTDSDHLAKLFEISAGTDVILRSSDTVDFFVSERFLRLALPAFASIISSGSVGENGVKVIAVPETSHTLRHLLLILYNCIDTPGVNDGELFFEMGHTIQKYSLQFIESKLRLTLRSSPIMTEEPLRAFAIATLFGWTEEAKSAAVNTLGTALESLRYCSELERIKGGDFFRLLEHRFKCVEVVGELITSNECTSPGDLIGSSGSSYPLSSSIKAKIQEILKQCPQGNAIRESTFLNIRFQRKTNGKFFEKSYKTLAKVIEEAVIKVPLNTGTTSVL